MNFKSNGSSKFLKASASAAVVASVIAPNVASVQAASEVSFSDLTEGDSFYSDIQILVKAGILNGFPDNTVRAQEEITRGQVAEMVASALDLDKNKVVDPGFSDVQKDKWYYGSVAALAEAGVVHGDANASTFRPEEPLTRAEVASVISQALDLDESESATNTFEDVSSSDWFAGAVGALYNNEITVGKSATEFAPRDTVTRGEVSAFLSRSLNLETSNVVISNVTDSTVDVDGQTYQLSENVKPLLNEANQEALKNAVISFESSNSTITSISYLELTNSGQAASEGEDERSGHVVLDGQEAVVEGNVKVSADYVTLQNLTVQGDLEIGSKVENSFYSDQLVVEGTTRILDDEVQAAGVTLAAANDQKQAKIVFNNASLQSVEVSKNNTSIQSSGTTTVSSLSVSSNVSINSSADTAIPKISLKDGSEEVEINGNVTELSLDSKSAISVTGAANFDSVKVNSNSEVNLNTSGEIKKVESTNKEAKLTLGKETKVSDIVLPEGSNSSDFISNFDDVKGNVENVNGEKNPDFDDTDEETSPPSSGGGSGGGGSNDNDGDQTAPTAGTFELMTSAENDPVVDYTKEGNVLTANIADIESSVTGVRINVEEAGTVTFGDRDLESETEGTGYSDMLTLIPDVSDGIEVGVNENKEVVFGDYGVTDITLDQLKVFADDNGEIKFDASLETNDGTTTSYTFILVVE